MTQINSIGYDASEYSQVKAQDWRLWIEQYTLIRIFQTLGIDFDGLHVGDFGSGTGLYSRMMIDFGATHVLAIEGDIKMIAQAKKESKNYHGLIRYQDSWIQETTGVGNCEVALGSYLLSYPKTTKELNTYCKAIASHLSKNGIYVGFGNNTAERLGGEQYKPYGFTKTHSAETLGDSNGAWVDWHINGLSQPIRNYNLYPDTYQKAFTEAGMQLFWQQACLHPSQIGLPHWSTFFAKTAPVIAMVAIKGKPVCNLSAWQK